MIEVENLSKIYGSTSALKKVSFAVQQGEILGFLGPNGAGKTTTMRILAGYLPATSGTVKIAGYDVQANSMAVRQLTGYLPETPPLYPEMTVEGFLFFVAKIKRVPAGVRGDKVKLTMERCGLLNKRKVLIKKLSKGYKQRVGIAQALVHDPLVIILDEPTVGLDPRQIIEVRRLIQSLAYDHTIILSTHILPEVSMICNRVAIINQGEIAAIDTPEEMSYRLAGGWGYEVEIEGEPRAIDIGLSLLEQISGVQSLEYIKLEHENRCRVQIKCLPQMESGREIASTIFSTGLDLLELCRTRATLEEVFLGLTTDENTENSSTDIFEAEDGVTIDSNVDVRKNRNKVQDIWGDENETEAE